MLLHWTLFTVSITLACDQNCIVCNSDICEQCIDNEKMILNDKGECICKPGYYADFEGNCENCHETCEICSGPQRCELTTQEGLISNDQEMLNKGRRLICVTISDCSLCVVITNCDACDPGFYNAGTQCDPCTETGCQACTTGVTFCDTCDNITYFANASGHCCEMQNCLDCQTARGACVLCEDHYGISATNTCHSCTDANCKECDGNAAVCNTCMPTFYKNPSNSCCAMDNCDDCSADPNSCSNCANTYGESNCVACRTGCLDCQASSTVCTACDTVGPPAYNLNAAGHCCRMANCADCDADSTNCVTCDVGYYNNGGSSCDVCSETGCQACTTGVAFCDTCDNITYFANASGHCCEMQNCLDCSASRSSCGLCEDHYGISATNTCHSCTDANCKECDGDASVCNTCMPTFYKNPSNSCCAMDNCDDCSADPTICTTCSSTYFGNGTASCQSCINDCQTCSSAADVCDTCTDTNASANNPATGCTCNAGWYDNNTGDALATCSQCAETGCISCTLPGTFCDACNGTTHFENSSGNCCEVQYCNDCATDRATCVQCLPSYGLISNACLTCTEANCAACNTDANVCDVCDAGYYLNPSSHCCTMEYCLDCSGTRSICTLCEDNYGINGSNACDQCNDINCKECDGDVNVCNVCDASYYLDTAKKCCIMDYCDDCAADPNTCTGCLSGYFGNGTNLCQICINDCATCSTAADVCDSCNDTNSSTNNPATGCTCNAGWFDDDLSDSIVTCSSCAEIGCVSCVLPGTFCDACDEITYFQNATGHCCEMDFCVDCATDRAVCVLCEDNYGLTATDTCLACVDPNCQVCDLDPNTCDTCFTGWYQDSADICCITDFCQDCSADPNICTTCLPGYFGNGTNLCQPCINDCELCSVGEDICDKCFDVQSYSNKPAANCTCNDGWYDEIKTDAIVTCKQCHRHCKLCDVANLCTECLDPIAVPSATAGCECPALYFDDNLHPLIVHCVSCHEHCATCNKVNICQTCLATDASPASAEGCICDDLFYDANLTVEALDCQSCHIHCATCDQANTCLTCLADHAVPDATGCKCDDNWVNDSTDPDVINCVPCHPHCATCDQIDKCLTCLNPLGWPDPVKGCYCMDGYYNTSPDDDVIKCEPCHHHCRTCDQPDICITCLDGGAQPSSLLGCNCRPGRFDNDPSITDIDCDPCNAECGDCVMALKCQTCQDPLAIVDPVSGCICPANTYDSIPGNSGISCQRNLYSACHIQCDTCDDSTDCLTCRDASKGAIPNGNGCGCPSGKYDADPAALTLSCLNCHVHCVTCDNANTCKTCVSANAKPHVSLGCECDAFYYNASSDSSTIDCQACHVHCAKCSKLDVCDTCIAFNAQPTTTGCICKPGYYDSDSTYNTIKCEKCHEDCFSCSQANICDTCKKQSFIPDSTAGCVCPIRSSENASGVCECDEGYDNWSDIEGKLDCQNETTFQCPDGQYKDVNYQCQPCFELCTRCAESYKNCWACVENAEVKPGGTCQCMSGFEWKGQKCQVKDSQEEDEDNFIDAGPISMDIEVTDENNVRLVFSRELIFQLEKEHVVLRINGEVFENWQLVQISDEEFELKIDWEGYEVLKENTFQLSFFPPEGNSDSVYLNEAEIFSYGKFNEFKEEDDYQDFDGTFEIIGMSLAIVALLTVIASNCITGMFSGTWLIINTFQVLCLVPLMNVRLTSEFAGFMRGLRWYNPVPNLFQYAGDPSQALFDRSADYGLDTSYWLFIAGQWLVIFIIILILLPVSFIMSRRESPLISKIGKFVLKNYMFNIPTRFLVESYLDITLANFIQLVNFTFEDVEGGISSVLTVFGMLCTVGGPILCTFLSLKLSLTRYRYLWETLFEDFEQDSVKKSLYYPIFMLRRIMYAFNLSVLYLYPELQAAFSISLSIITVAYISAIHPFASMRNSLINTLAEGVVIFCSISSLVIHVDIGVSFDTIMTYGSIVGVIIAVIVILINAVIEAIIKIRTRIIIPDALQQIKTQNHYTNTDNYGVTTNKGNKFVQKKLPAQTRVIPDPNHLNVIQASQLGVDTESLDILITEAKMDEVDAFPNSDMASLIGQFNAKHVQQIYQQQD